MEIRYRKESSLRCSNSDLRAGLLEEAAGARIEMAATSRLVLELESSPSPSVRILGAEPNNNATERTLHGLELWRQGSYVLESVMESRPV